MSHATSEIALPKPIQLADVSATTVEQLADALLRSSDEQHVGKESEFDDEDERVDFLQACDSFNFWRMQWRLKVEIDDSLILEGLIERLRATICERRNYNQDEFGLASEATENRARFPFGLDPLEYAHLLARKHPIRVFVHEIADPLSLQVLGIAVQLQRLNGPKPILLPIESLRALLHCRKLVVSGVVRRLLKYSLLLDVGEGFHTGKAREFHLLAKEGIHFEFVKGTGTEPKLPL